MITTEQNYLRDAAIKVWKDLERAKSTFSTCREDGITDDFINRLKVGYPGYVIVDKYTPYEESGNGADWLWTFRNSLGNHAVSMLVQAKLLDTKEVHYPEIKRRVGNTSKRQVDVLISTANAMQVAPMYAFYNHLFEEWRVPKQCLSLDDSAEIESWGISMADAYSVRRLLNDQTFDSHKVNSRPLHCMLCAGGASRRPADFGSSALLHLALSRVSQWHRENVGIKQLIEPPSPMVSGVIQAAINSEDAYFRNFRNEIREGFPNLGGAIIFDDAPE